MAFTKYVVPALAAAGAAYAQCSVAGTTTISTPGDIPDCTTFSGNIAVATGAATGVTADFGNLKVIDGDFKYEGDNTVQTIMLGSLSRVTGDFSYSNLSALSDTGLSALKEVGGALTFEGLGGLSELGLTAGLDTVGMVSIINTGVQSLEGLTNVSKITGLTISDNTNLGEISLGVSEIGMISIGAGQQGNGGQSASFSNLENAKSIVIRNSSSVDLGALTNVTNDLRLIGNTFESFSAKNLSQVGALVITNNAQLKNISFPILEEVRSGNATLYMANNTKLNTMGPFPKLTVITGDAYFYGNFSKLDMSSINRIAGALRVETAADNFDCDAVDGLKDDKTVRGAEKCKSGDKSKLNGGSDSTSSSDSSAASSSSFSSPLEIPADFMSGFAILASLLSMFM